MATKLEPVEVLLVGFGWTAAIIGKELTDAGMQVLALERGGFRDTVPDFAIPQIQDELRYAVRHEMFQEPARQTITFRNDRSQEALPMRKLGSFNPGTGVGGAGVHWNGQHWRFLPSDFRQKSHVEERYGKGFIPDGMTIQDWGVTYEELEPHFDRFEYLCGTSGAAGNLNGEKQDGGNPFEGARSRDYPNPPLKRSFATEKFDKAAREVGFNPFPCPASNTSRPYTNPLGVQMGACTYCGYCEWFGCGNYSKSTPQTTILPVLLRRDNFSYRTGCNVTRVNLDSSGRRATGVTYVDTEGEEYEQPADLVVLCAYATHNVHLLLLSGIGEAYDPATGTGTLGRNYAYQMMSGVELFFDDNLNPFMGAGALGQAIDDFNGDNFDHGPHGFIGGAYIALWTTGGRPILQHQLPEDTPGWGSKWKQAMADNYLRSTSLSVHGSVMSYEDAYLDLDPTSRAMTEGVAPGGVHLYPAFPYPFFTRVRPEDLQDIKAYLDTLEPVRQEKKENELPWPLSWRTMLVGWNQLFFDEGVYQPDPEKTEEWNRGAYLVEGLGHCSACHSPKNLAGAVDTDEAFKGGFGEKWFAPDLSGDLRQGLGEWSIEDIVEYLKTASNRFSSAGGPMAEVVERSTQHLRDADLRAIAVYLKDLPGETPDEQPAGEDLNQQVMAEGEGLFVDNCAGCHRMQGQGQEGIFPALDGSSVLQQEEPDSAIQLVLGGAEKPATPEKPTAFAMPAFGWKLGDEDVAALLTYLRNAFGNQAAPVEPGMVADVRATIQDMEGNAALSSE